MGVITALINDLSADRSLRDNDVSDGAGEGNRTLVVSLEGFCSTIELHPPSWRPCHCLEEAVNRLR